MREGELWGVKEHVKFTHKLHLVFRVVVFEYDRGTMSLKRRSLEQASFYRKIITYYALWKHGTFKEEFGWNRVRVLTITSSEKRCQGLVDLTKQINNGNDSGLFHFSHTDKINKIL